MTNVKKFEVKDSETALNSKVRELERQYGDLIAMPMMNRVGMPGSGRYVCVGIFRISS